MANLPGIAGCRHPGRPERIAKPPSVAGQVEILRAELGIVGPLGKAGAVSTKQMEGLDDGVDVADGDDKSVLAVPDDAAGVWRRDDGEAGGQRFLGDAGSSFADP